MINFKENYVSLNEEMAIEYAKTTLDMFEKDEVLFCKEIGDGNLNYVFRVRNEEGDKSIIIKQAGPFARISHDLKVSPDRNRIESEILKLQYELTNGLVPMVYKYDPVMNCCIMEDLYDYEILRKALMEHKKFPKFADHITTFMVNTLFWTSDLAMDHNEKKDRIKSFINPDLCKITEDLVFTEPFFDCTRNDLSPRTREFALNELWNDEKLRLETAKLKFEFMTNAQALIHGDLHTGSIFVNSSSTKVIDPEFAFYGPSGYDVGNLIANLIFAYENADATIEDPHRKIDYKSYLETTMIEIIDKFIEKFMKMFDRCIRERVASYKGFKNYYVEAIVRDASAITGCELCRRVVGLAHVADITTIKDEDKRYLAEKRCLYMGKRFILERENIKCGKDFIKILRSSSIINEKNISLAI